VTLYQTNFWWKTLNQLAQGVPKKGTLYMYVQQNSVYGNLCDTSYSNTQCTNNQGIAIPLQACKRA